MSRQMLNIGRVVLVAGGTLIPLSFVYAAATVFEHPPLFLLILIVGVALLISGFIIWLIGKTHYLAETNAPPEAYVWDTRPKHLR
jgi:hypothetical protein